MPEPFLMEEKMRYRYLLMDNDNTLMDFDAAERHALQEVLAQFDLPGDAETCALYHRINDTLWKALERGETTQAALKTERFVQLLSALGRSDLDGGALGEAFSEALSHHADLMPDAMRFLNAVHGRMKLALVSNGIARVQRGRLARCPFAHMLDAVVISEEVGVRKPDPRMVTLALEKLGCEDAREAVLLGDSASADVAAAAAAGVDSIHLTKGEASPLATWHAKGLMEALEILGIREKQEK